MYFTTHNHSGRSSLDGVASAELIVRKAVKMGQPAIGLTDHGHMGNTTQLYLEAKKHGIEPLPGVEAYLVDPEFDMSMGLDSKEGKATKRFHLTMLALNEVGYQQLQTFVSATHTENRFHRFPRCTVEDLVRLGSLGNPNIAILTGCLSGVFMQHLMQGNVNAAHGHLLFLQRQFKHVYVEIMNHNIPENVLMEIADDNLSRYIKTETDLAYRATELANRVGLPTIITPDSHYLDIDHKQAHIQMKKMTFADGGFSGDDYHLPDEDYMRGKFDTFVWEAAQEGFKDLLSNAKVVIPPLDTFKVHVPSVINNAKIWLVKKCFEELVKRGLPQEYEDRLSHELSIINHQHMADYFYIVWDYVNWARRNHICMEARGSANGSLVCYLLGITQIDPLEWDIDFERFMSSDRTKPPDIDMDVESENRERVVNYIKAKYPGAQRIGSWNKIGINDKTGKGSVLVSWHASKRTQCEKQARAEGLVGVKAAERSKELYKKNYAHVETMEDVRRVAPDEYPGLVQLASFNSVTKSRGTHAGGILLSGDTVKVEDWIPTGWIASSKTVVTQYDMEDLEPWGFLKLDVLGQEGLTVMRRCQELMGRADPTDFSWIPNDDPDACRALCTGRQDIGIFHFDGWTKARGAREMGIRSTEDAVIAIALFMPAVMDSGHTKAYIERRNNAALARRVKYLHPIFEKHFGKTFGAVVFQDQVVDVMRDIGMDVNAFLKIVKTSGKGATEKNDVRMKAMRKKFDELCDQLGITEKDEAWAQTAGFISYGFGKAHSAGYGVRAYRTGYLKAHFPLEYMTALLETFAGKAEKERVYAIEARRMGQKILDPHVNFSGERWTMDKTNGGIRKGLTSIPKVGAKAAAELHTHAPYLNVDDLAAKVNHRTVTGVLGWREDQSTTGVLGHLRSAGALTGLFNNNPDLEVRR